MKPQTISEQMLYNTVRLEGSRATGTGFFFHFVLAENKVVPIIITNKHVVVNNKKEPFDFLLHVKNQNEPYDEKIKISFNPDWHFHPSHDLCFCFVASLLHELKKTKEKDIFYIPLTMNFIWDNHKLEELSALEDVVMVGYPNGLWDQKNNLPLLRKGITASHSARDFNSKGIGVVDIACFPGSSGSPILVLNENGYTDKKGTTHVGGKRLVFLGVLFSGPQVNAKGELIVENIPTQKKVSALTPIMINIGYYIKAAEILAFKPIIEKFVPLK